MQVKNRCFVLSVGKPYNFIPEGETEPLTGCKMYYLGTSDVLKTFVDEENGSLGHFPQKATMPTEFFDSVREVGLPCYADITYDLRFTSKGTDLTISSVDFIKNDKGSSK